MFLAAEIAEKTAELNKLKQLHQKLQELYLHKHGVILNHLKPDNEVELAANDLCLNQNNMKQFVFTNPNQGIKPHLVSRIL